MSYDVKHWVWGSATVWQQERQEHVVGWLGQDREWYARGRISRHFSHNRVIVRHSLTSIKGQGMLHICIESVHKKCVRGTSPLLNGPFKEALSLVYRFQHSMWENVWDTESDPCWIRIGTKRLYNAFISQCWQISTQGSIWMGGEGGEKLPPRQCLLLITQNLKMELPQWSLHSAHDLLYKTIKSHAQKEVHNMVHTVQARHLV